MGLYNRQPRAQRSDQNTTPDASPVGPEDSNRFLHFNQVISVNSSNVASAQYDRSRQELTLEYENGSAYVYREVSEAEAQSFLTAPSKGEWVWDNLRVRGSKTAHRKPFVKSG